MANTTHILRMTREEFMVVARLIGHHVTGTMLNRLYEEEIYPYSDGKLAERMGPLETSTENFYPGRPMVRANAQS